MQQTPAHEFHNSTLLERLPTNAKKLIEFGSGSGALAREYKKINPTCHYLGIEINPTYAALSKRYCDDCHVVNIEQAPDEFWALHADRDCWILGDVLEHLLDPWSVLNKIQQVLPKHGIVAVSIPNVQNWFIQSNLSVGNFRYDTIGLLDKTHIRWFTRDTIFELFDRAGLKVNSATARIYDTPTNDQIIPCIRALAVAMGGNPDQAEADAMAVQFIFIAEHKD
jgi:SAM-dependent methyltransferase